MMIIIANTSVCECMHEVCNIMFIVLCAQCTYNTCAYSVAEQHACLMSPYYAYTYVSIIIMCTVQCTHNNYNLCNIYKILLV